MPNPALAKILFKIAIAVAVETIVHINDDILLFPFNFFKLKEDFHEK